MERFNKARKLFGSSEFSSDSSRDSVIYISSDEETSDGWDSDWSTDTEEMVRRIETQVQAEPIPIAGRRMTTASDEPGPSSVPSDAQTTPKLDKTYFDEKLCYAPSRGNTKRRIELCKTILPVLESPLSPPAHERGPSMDTPVIQPESSGFHASFHIQNALPYTDTWKPQLQRANPLTSQLSGKKPTSMVLMQAVFFSLHPLCRRLPPVTAQGLQQRLLARMWPQELSLSIKVN